MPTPTLTIRPAAPLNDAAGIAAIYNHYIAETDVTFEEVPVRADDFVSRMQTVQSESLPWLVAEDDGRIAGYAYATRWRDRSAYRFSSEITVYLGPNDTGRGLGTKLYDALFPLVKSRGIRAVMAGIALPNAASIALHEKFGMRKVAHFERVGFKFDRWIDVGYWQSTL